MPGSGRPMPHDEGSVADDVPTSHTWYLVALALLALQGAFVAAEVAFLSIGTVRARHLVAERRRGAAVLSWLLSNRGRLFSTVLVANTALGFAAESIVTLAVGHGHSAYAHYVGLAAVVLVSVIFVESMPVIVAAKASERAGLVLAPLAWTTYLLLWPVVTGLSAVAHGLLRVVGAVRRESPRITEDEVISIIDESQVQEDEKSMLRRVLDFGDRTVEEVMVPRTDMVCLEADATVSDAMAAMVDSRHSRLPVYQETRDNVVGVLYSKDLLPHLAAGHGEVLVTEAMRPHHLIHEKRSVSDLVREFRESRRMMALVTDEYGGIAGLVTLEDALEEVVGEIFDEYDLEEARIERIDDTTFAMRGSTGIHDVMRELEIELPEGDYETMSGLVHAELGHLADAGESVVLPSGLRVEVIEADRRRVKTIRLTVPQPEADADSKPDDEADAG